MLTQPERPPVPLGAPSSPPAVAAGCPRWVCVLLAIALAIALVIAIVVIVVLALT